MPFDERKLALRALELASNELYDRLMLLAKTSPEVFRRGAKAIMEEQQTSTQRTQVRQELRQLGQDDPAELSKVLGGMIEDTSEQEVVDLLAGGRLQE